MTNTNTKATRAEIPFGSTSIEGYLLPENLWTPTNKFGVSKTQAVLLAYPNYDRNQCTKRYKRIIESQEALSPSSFRHVNSSKPYAECIELHPGVRVETEGKDARKVDLLSVESIVPFLKICKRLGSSEADDLLDLLAGLSLQQLFSDGFRMKFDEESRQDWLEKRQEGKQVRLDLTDAVKQYVAIHRDKLSAGAIQWMYVNCSEAVNLGLFGRKSNKLCSDLGVKDRSKLRDALTADELRWISQIEELAARLIINHDYKPLDAVKESLTRNVIPMVNRKVEQPKAG
jgi:hypothetical protein